MGMGKVLVVAGILVGLVAGSVGAQEQEPSTASPLAGLLQLAAGIGGGLLGSVVGGAAALPDLTVYAALGRECEGIRQRFLIGLPNPDPRVEALMEICSFVGIPRVLLRIAVPPYIGTAMGTFAGIVGAGQALGVPGSLLGTALGIIAGQGVVLTLAAYISFSELTKALASWRNHSQELPSTEALENLSSIVGLGLLLLPALLGVLGYYWGP